MTTRQHTIEKKKDTHKQIWEWEETPELVEALKKLHIPLEERKVTPEDTLENYTLGDK